MKLFAALMTTALVAGTAYGFGTIKGARPELGA